MTEEGGKSAAKIVGGSVLIALSLGAVAVDAVNNFQYGAQSSMVQGIIGGSFAIGLAAFSEIKETARNKSFPRAMTAALLVATAWCGFNAHNDNMAQKREHRAAITRAYNTAQADAERARTGADRAQADVASAQKERREALALAATFPELTPSAELAQMITNTAERAKKEGSKERGGCGTLCRASEDEVKALQARKGVAASREAALAQADEAQKQITDAQARIKTAQDALDRVKAAAPAAPEAPDATAVMMAGIWHVSPDEAARTIETGWSLFIVALCVLFAYGTGFAFATFREGMGWAKPSPAKEIAKEVVEELRVALTVDEAVAAFIDQKLKIGEGETKATELQSAASAWVAEKADADATLSQKRLSEALENAGVGKRRTKAGWVYGAALAA